jgi:hypothetical protein
LISATRDRRCQHAPDHESLVLDAVSDQWARMVIGNNTKSYVQIWELKGSKVLCLV